MRVMIVVTHLLGTGHLARALTLARAFDAAGHTSCVVSGGMPVPHLTTGETELIQLPPLRSDGTSFARLLDETGTPAGAEIMTARSTALTSAITACEPDVLITELFPFGRRVLKDEFLVALETAAALNPAPLILSSVRDILAPPSKPARVSATADVLDRFYDAVLVHADASISPLEDSWPVTPEIRQKLRYTGYVARPAAAGKPHTDRTGIVVSTGGGAVADHLFDISIACARDMPRQQWHLLVTGENAAERIARFQRSAGPGVEVTPASNAFAELLRRAAASVSLCGYNTALDVLQTDVPAVFVPFDADGETEQTLRARALARQAGISLLPNSALAPDTLKSAIQSVITAPARSAPAGIFDGASESVSIAEALWKGKYAD
ncbi:glycosyltransferase [uncultured Roseobacter sp.]|uniref:glycosyltransferase family protein n=1 Tax=uncultured Roseobacter sp. TaxID=114847 RepID=UPI00262E0E6B|nr:glycosyltransferase [uncultured Roseobacter sp.]